MEYGWHCQLPIEMRFEKRNMVCLGVFSSKEGISFSTSVLDPFIDVINESFYPWTCDLPNHKQVKLRYVNIGTVLDGM